MPNRSVLSLLKSPHSGIKINFTLWETDLSHVDSADNACIEYIHCLKHFKLKSGHVIFQPKKSIVSKTFFHRLVTGRLALFHKHLFMQCNYVYHHAKWSCLLFRGKCFFRKHTHRRPWADRISQGLDVIMPNKSSIPAVREEVRKKNQKFFLLCGALSAATLSLG